MTKENKFCALGSLYHGESPNNLRQSLKSVFTQSSPVPVILVIDGPISRDLLKVVHTFENEFYKIIELPENVGLGSALNEGIKKIKNEFDYVIRFDTDDINEPDRFRALVSAIELTQADIMSSNMIEFSNDKQEKILGIRAVPENSVAIAQSIHYRNPFNHPAVAFRISFVLSVGGYEDVRYFEDWYLWAKMIQAGARTSNLVDPLVRFRGGKRALSRRRGWNYVKYELSFFLLLNKLRLPGRWVIFFIFPVRLIARFLPFHIFGWIYYMSRKVF